MGIKKKNFDSLSHCSMGVAYFSHFCITIVQSCVESCIEYMWESLHFFALFMSKQVDFFRIWKPNCSQYMLFGQLELSCIFNVFLAKLVLISLIIGITRTTTQRDRWTYIYMSIRFRWSRGKRETGLVFKKIPNRWLNADFLSLFNKLNDKLNNKPKAYYKHRYLIWLAWLYRYTRIAFTCFY